jgi:hypothetical protein
MINEVIAAKSILVDAYEKTEGVELLKRLYRYFINKRSIYVIHPEPS